MSGKPEKADFYSAMLKRAIDVLMVLNPAATGMGVVFGGSLYLFCILSDGMLIQHGVTSMTKIGFRGLFGFISFGVFSFNLPSYMRRSRDDDEQDKMLAKIEDGLKKGTLSQAQARLHFNAIIAEQVNQLLIKKAEGEEE